MSSSRIQWVCRVALAAGVLVLGAFAPPMSAALGPVFISAQAAVQPAPFNSRVVDASGVLSDEEEQSLTQAINDYAAQSRKVIYVVYTPSFGDGTPEDWARAAVHANGEGNTLVVGISPELRQYALFAAPSGPWTSSDMDRIDAAVFDQLLVENWAGAGFAAVEASAGTGGSGSGASSTGGDSSGGGSSGGLWLAGAGGAAVATGGAIWAVGRHNRKKKAAQSLATARELDPGDKHSLQNLPLETLARRSEEVIVQSDDSLRRAREELNLAVGEFGEERARPFTKAVNTATAAVQRAYQIQAELNDSIPETPQQQRQMYIDIISSAGTAERALDAQAEKFQELRNLLINADSILDALTQRLVSLRSRLEPARTKLTRVQAEYSPEVIASIVDNPEMAAVALKEAEAHLSAGRNLQARPAGEQGGLVDEIRESERALELADSLLLSIERADANIAAARANLGALIKEVAEEIAEAEALKAAGPAQGVKADWEDLDTAVSRAQDALDQARAHGQSDPLASYTRLMDADSALDIELDEVREETSSQERRLQLLDQQLESAGAQMQAAEDLIATRGRIIDAQARTALARAERAHSQALHLRTSDTRMALDYARDASRQAQQAVDRAESDIRAYQRRVQAQQTSDAVGNVVTGIVLGQLLGGGGGGGHRGGFGGGGGGGGFRGGSF